MSVLEARLSLMEEENFWIYYLYIAPGPTGPDSFRLTDSRERPLTQPKSFKTEFDLATGSYRCVLTMQDGSVVNTRVVDLRTCA